MVKFMKRNFARKRGGVAILKELSTYVDVTLFTIGLLIH